MIHHCTQKVQHLKDPATGYQAPEIQQVGQIEGEAKSFSSHNRTRGYAPNATRTVTPVKINTPARQPDMLRAALWYAQRGWAVFPLHEPLFNHQQGYTCTCEYWRHSDRCKNHPDPAVQKKYLAPGQHCDDPGKHSRGVKSWAAESTTDPDTIRTWWAKYPTANIGIDCGKSALLVLDADSYKQTYGDLGDLLTIGDRQTVTSLTGGGGEHLVYAMPPGKHYGNATGDLPQGIDIRGQGGYIVAPPSLHKTGQRYQFEEGYNPVQIAVKPVPDALQVILDQAQRAYLTKLATFSPGDVIKPDLKVWALSEKTVDLVMKAQPVGQRSEADQSVMLALVAQGATDDDIRAVFTHYPIGEKYRQDGDHYLAVSISAARSYYAEHGNTAEVADPVTGELYKLADIMQFVRLEIAKRRLPDSQAQVALAALQIFEHAKAVVAPMSDRYLAGLAAVEKKTANNALKGTPIIQKVRDDAGAVIKRVRTGRKPDGLDQWLLTRVTRGNGILADEYRLSDAMFAAYREKIPTIEHQEDYLLDDQVSVLLWGFSRGVLATVEENMVDDAFIRNIVPAKFRRRAKNYVTPEGSRLAQLDALMNSPAEDGRKRLKSLTQKGLRAIACLEQKNGQGYTELAESMNCHPATVAAVVDRLARRQLQETPIPPLVRVVQMGREKRVFLYRRWQERLTTLRPLMYTDGLLKARQIHYARQRIARINKILPNVQNEEICKVYNDIRDRTQSMIEAIEGAKTPREAAQVLHQHQNTVAPAPVVPTPAPATQATSQPRPEGTRGPSAVQQRPAPQSAREQWQRLLGDLDPWQAELEAADLCTDLSKRQAARALRSFFTGTSIDKPVLVAAASALNPALLSTINWNAIALGGEA